MKNEKQFMMVRRMMALMMVCMVALGAVSCSDDDDDDTPALTAPALNNASAVTPTGFTVTWTAVPGADKYVLDVATDNAFANPVTDYNKKEITGALTINVTGLDPEIKYYFRLYAKKGSTLSPASVVKDVTTPAVN